jgi:EpsI family protein
MKTLLQSKFVYALTVVLLAQAVLFYAASHGEATPLASPLVGFPTNVGGWHMLQDGEIDKETRDVLKADDYLTRGYLSREGGANLFIAYFRTQRQGQSPHSPKNCLPGSGWEQTTSGRVDVPIANRSAAPNGFIHINQYVVEKGDSQAVVYYWYESRGRVIADEFAAKFYLVSDSIRLHRSDTALVRVWVPVFKGRTQVAEKVGTDFVQSLYPVVKGYLPQ